MTPKSQAPKENPENHKRPLTHTAKRILQSIVEIAAKMNDNAMYIASVVATYWVVSISMVYLNKVLMSNEGISVPAPLFVTWYQ